MLYSVRLEPGEILAILFGFGPDPSKWRVEILLRVNPSWGWLILPEVDIFELTCDHRELVSGDANMVASACPQTPKSSFLHRSLVRKEFDEGLEICFFLIVMVAFESTWVEHHLSLRVKSLANKPLSLEWEFEALSKKVSRLFFNP